MTKKVNLSFFLIFLLFTHCSFDKKTGIWKGIEEEKRIASEIELRQRQVINVSKVYTSENAYSEEVLLKKAITLSQPKKESKWTMAYQNHQNFLGNNYFPEINSIFLKKKIGKNKFSISKLISSPLSLKNNLILSDDNGTIYNITKSGKIIWKKNIYKKIYKRVYKNLTFSISKNKIYISDNIGFIYALELDSGKLVWIKNHGVPIKSSIKIFKNKIYLTNQDNRLICIDSKDGSKIWDIRSISSFIKSQNFLSLAITKKGNLLAVNSSGDLFKVDGNNGRVFWSINALSSMFAHDTDFFKSSEIVVDNENIIFSAGQSIFSISSENGYINWEKNIRSTGAPIIDKNNIFFVTENGFFIILNKINGQIISATNILKILKKKKRTTSITGFIMGSGKIYAVTQNGYLIVSSATTGKTEYFKKIGKQINTSPIINDASMYVLTENSKIIGFN